jgi:hypothetical protein
MYGYYKFLFAFRLIFENLFRIRFFFFFLFVYFCISSSSPPSGINSCPTHIQDHHPTVSTPLQSENHYRFNTHSTQRLQATVASKRPLSSCAVKMDIVPSPGLMNSPFVASPHMSIYDQDKPDRWAGCHSGPSPYSNTNNDAYVNDETYALDDKYEDSTLQTLLTTEVMNSLQTSASSNIPKDFQWGAKPDIVNTVHMSTDNLGTTPMLAELNMDPELFVSVSELLNTDSNDSALDLLCNSINSTKPTSTVSGLVESSKPPTCYTTPIPRNSEPKVVSSSAQIQRQKSVEQVSDSYIRHYASARNNFPPRASQPPIVIVAPVKKEEEQIVRQENLKSPSDYDKLQAQSPYLHKLLKQEPGSIKAEYQNSIAASAKSATCMMAKNELPAQIVPLSIGATKRNSNGFIKTEPTSPEKPTPVYLSEESIEEKWKDIEQFIHNPEGEEPVKKRKRCGKFNLLYLNFNISI